MREIRLRMMHVQARSISVYKPKKRMQRGMNRRTFDLSQYPDVDSTLYE